MVGRKMHFSLGVSQFFLYKHRVRRTEGEKQARRTESNNGHAFADSSRYRRNVLSLDYVPITFAKFAAERLKLVLRVYLYCQHTTYSSAAIAGLHYFAKSQLSFKGI